MMGRHRHRSAKIVATLGPSSSDDATIRALFAAPGVVVVAGLPFGRSGTTNLLHVARIDAAR